MLRDTENIFVAKVKKNYGLIIGTIGGTIVLGYIGAGIGAAIGTVMDYANRKTRPIRRVDTRLGIPQDNQGLDDKGGLAIPLDEHGRRRCFLAVQIMVPCLFAIWLVDIILFFTPGSILPDVVNITLSVREFLIGVMPILVEILYPPFVHNSPYAAHFLVIGWVLTGFAMAVNILLLFTLPVHRRRMLAVGTTWQTIRKGLLYCLIAITLTLAILIYGWGFTSGAKYAHLLNTPTGTFYLFACFSALLATVVYAVFLTLLAIVKYRLKTPA